MTKSLQSVLTSLPEYANRRAIGVRGEYGFRWWTYAELHQHALRVAHLFAQRGLRPGDRVILWAPNSPEWVACLLGAALRGLVIVPVDAGSSREEVRQLAQRTEAAMLLTGDRQNPAGLAIVAVALKLLKSIEPGDIQSLHVPVDGATTAVILFTAGTSGEPRGVILTHGNLASQIEHFSYWRPILRLIPTRLLALSPLSHVQGLMLSACVPLSLGLTIIYSSSIEPEHLERSLREGHVRVLSTVPRVLAALQASLVSKSRKASVKPGWRLRRKLLGPRFRVVLVGGATLPETQERFWRRLGCVVVQGYGSTETAAFVSVNRPLVGRRGSVGKMVHRESLRLSDEGEILVRGPHLSPGYFGKENGQERTADGYLRTGDIGRLDSRGRMFFLGRRQDRIVTAEGHTLHPDAIETVLREVQGVADAVVMPVSRDGLEQVHAVLVVEPATAAAAIFEANRRLPDAARIRSWTVWTERDFPRGALEKPLRERIMEQTRRLLERDEPISSRRMSIAEETLETAMEDPERYSRLFRVRDVLRRTDGPRKDFNDLLTLLQPLGMDSIDVAELMTLLQEGQTIDVETVSVNPNGAPPRANVPKRNPLWQMWPGAAALRVVTRPLLFTLIRHRLRARRTGKELPLDGRPLLFALSNHDREHAVDFVAILLALPEQYRRRLIVTIGDGHFFESYFFRKPEDSVWWRWYVTFLVKFGVPAVLPYILAPGNTVVGIRENCRAIDAGFSPVMTWNRFSATVACETGIPVVPIRMRGSRGDWKADMEIEFGAATEPLSGTIPAEFVHVVGQQLSAMGVRGRPAYEPGP